MTPRLPKTTGIIILAGAILLVYAFLKLFQLDAGLSSFASGVTAPVYGAFYSAGNRISAVFSGPGDREMLETENERLRTENLELKQQIANLQSAQQENATLRQLLDYFETETNKLPRTIARVVGRDPENPSILILNAGRRDGIVENQAVVVEEGIMIAKIDEVLSRTSTARLLTDSESRVAVTISGGAPSSKIARGERGLSLILDQIPQGEILASGQLVITSGLEPAIPRGLLIGEVEEILSEPNDLFQSAVLRPITDYQQLLHVAVILNQT